MENIVICIPTFKREKELKRLFSCLLKQQNIPESYNFEILIMNNDEENYAENIINTIHSPFFDIHCIHVKNRGLSNVRNAAVKWVLERNVKAIIFVDDDEVVPPHWLSNMIEAWKKHKGDIITGPVEQILPSSASRFVRMFGLLDPQSHSITGKRMSYACSNNTLVSREVLESLGPSFHPALNFTRGEDTLYFHQAHLKGFSIYWDNSIQIEEPTAPERAATRYALRRWFEHGMNRIVINKILYSDEWKKKSLNTILEVYVGIFRGFASSIIRSDKKRFGQTVLRLAWFTGNIFNFARYVIK
jgi:glycosyltransferase involved in cell wall biosynthesis